ncbi:MAG: response regulator, partial [Gammaproteobacteria bacterium]|nr:response regulator [Gammaproteobacteria bacterium]
VRPVNTDEEKVLLRYLLDKTKKSVDSDVQVDEEVSEILEVSNQQYNDKCDIDISEIGAELDVSISDFETAVNKLDDTDDTDDSGAQADEEVFEILEVSNKQYNDQSDIDISEIGAELDISINDLAAEINQNVNNLKTGLADSSEALSEVDDAEGEFNIEDVLEISRFYEEDSELETNDFESELSLDDLVADDVDSFKDENTVNIGDLAEEYKSDDQQTIEINAEQKELISLIAEELIEFNHDKESILLDAEKNTVDFKNNLLSIADQTENIRNAIGIIGLEGLSNVADFVSKNIHTLATGEAALTRDQLTMLGQWADYILSYLNDIGNKQVCAEIIQFLKKPLWPELMEDDISESLELLLTNPQLKEEEREVRKNTASPEDMSLVLPDDVNPELLEGLLQDLPIQTGEFSVAIHNLYDQHNIEYLEIAQRIAHTLKGAGNVVGVKGIANLTHNLEDILEIQFKAKQLPAGELLEVLVDAADCLETMSEALLGIDEPPDNAQSVYQSILDWANKLDADGATCLDLAVAKRSEIKLVAAEEKNDVKEISSAAKPPLNIENMLRVPAKLADDLLRLAGENLISTSQIQEYIKIIQTRYKNLKLQDQSLQKFSYDLEHIVDVQGITNSGSINNVNNDGFDSLELDQFHELHSMSRRLVELAADSIELTQILEKDFLELQNLVVNQGQLQKENEQLVLRTRMVPISTIVPRLKRGVKQASRLTGKSVDLHVEDNDTYMDSEVLNSLIEPLMHLLRNSVGHGIEDTQERQEKGKVNHGQINLIFLQRGDQIVIKITDDGRGLSLSEIKNKAISLGLVKSENEVTEQNLQNFILQPGFSTRTEVSQMSGRGIGLDVVNSKIRELKGSIEIQSAEGQGCQFLLTLPISSFSVHSLLVRVRENIYAFSNRGIEEILYSGLGELQKVGHETMFKLEDQYYNISMIESLLSLPEDRREGDRDNRPVILVKDDTASHTAILVQDVIDSRDVVVKSMGEYIPKIPGIIGATVLGDGSVVPVIDLPELMLSRQIIDNTYTEERIELHEEKKLPYVLVVDDSLSARKSLAQFVEDLGLQVRTARDGMEAVSLIDVRKPDLILVDMEMPRMNGLELTGHIRASSITQDMPVIMITSRSTDKHRKAAMDKGVDHYMVKPFAEDELAIHINSALKTA